MSDTKNLGGRPTGCTPEIIERAGELARAGNYFECIYMYLEIPKSTAYRWREDGLKGIEPYATFWDTLERGWAAAEARLTAQIQQHGQADQPGQWTALAWFLERRFPDRYGRRNYVKQEVSGPGGQPVAQMTVTPEQLALMAKRETPPDDDQ